MTKRELLLKREVFSILQTAGDTSENGPTAALMATVYASVQWIAECFKGNGRTETSRAVCSGGPTDNATLERGKTARGTALEER